jgi:myosin heavy subunit
VEYHVDGFLDKNKDHVTDDIVGLLINCQAPLLREMFHRDKTNRSSLHTKQTVGTNFKASCPLPAGIFLELTYFCRSISASW